jgi:antitoxin component YwqK of YwqJK toxin-antitoxin module
MNKLYILIYLLLGWTLFCNGQGVNKTGPIYQYKHNRIDRLDLYEPSKYPIILETYKKLLERFPTQPDSLNIRVIYYKNQRVKWIGYIDNKDIYFGPGMYYTKNGDPDRMFTSFNGVLNGECIFYKKNKIQMAGSFKDGKPNGEWTYYTKGGKIKRTQYIRDRIKR